MVVGGIYLGVGSEVIMSSKVVGIGLLEYGGGDGVCSIVGYRVSKS